MYHSSWLFALSSWDVPSANLAISSESLPAREAFTALSSVMAAVVRSSNISIHGIICSSMAGVPACSVNVLASFLISSKIAIILSQSSVVTVSALSLARKSVRSSLMLSDSPLSHVAPPPYMRRMCTEMSCRASEPSFAMGELWSM